MKLKVNWKELARQLHLISTPNSYAIESYTVPFLALHCALLSLTLCSISKRLWGLKR